ncbi:MAG: sugar phosphate nucleotidyltransferase, partial [bacterium]
MKVAILAGGVGTRLVEETEIKPKPMVEIGNQPILWHIMMHYSQYGFKHFVIALGYRGEVIKKYMVDYCSLHSNLTVNLRTGEVQIHDGVKPDWTVELVDTGISTLTGGRIKRLAPYLGNETFMLTWGDGVSNVNLHELLAFHRSHGKLATLTAVRPPARFGHLDLVGDHVAE